MLFSIIVPVYKVEKYLKKCVDSILAQTYQDFQLILVDDGSTDSSPLICDEYAGRDKRIIVIHKKNGGVVSARLEGITIAEGQYTLYLDADDWIAGNLLQELAEVIEKHHAPDMILFDAYKVYTEKKELMIQSLEPGYYDRERMEKEIIPSMMYDRNRYFLTAQIAGQLWNKAIKTSILKEHLCTDTSLYKAEDFACVYECIYFSESFYYLKKSLYFYNKMNEGSAMTKYDATYFRNHSRVIDYTMKHLGQYSEIVKRQIEAHNVSGICIGVFHEVRHGRKLLEASKHIKKELTETTCLKNANCKDLPLHAKVYIFLLKHKMYFVALLMAKIFLKLKGK